ncbi:MAG: 5-(carboxyamino)imidazole ribonucleotide synthase [Propionivibrio sp.]|nr:5-(carboxyamino)imidazole ribonucleotide synthase [Propionivibrio sp.]
MIQPGATLGLLGGGQLGRMFVLAARALGYRVTVLDLDADSPAAQVADHHLAAAYDDESALEQLARECAAVTTEFENVPAASLEFLAARVPVRPGANAVAIAQDRALEKRFLLDNGLATARFAIVDGEAAIASAVREVGAPALLKTTRLGYDGKGQARVDDLDAAQKAFVELGSVPCVLEERVALEREISVVLARGADGEVRCYPVTENRHRDGILDVSLAPARVAEDLAMSAIAIATTIAAKLDYCGVLAVEFFICTDGRLLVNEFAPRPHNSGHWTLDAAATSQFEQQVRALCGRPLGDSRTHAAAAMVNLLGDIWDGAHSPAWEGVQRRPGARLHLYGKREARPGRKMGHVTCIGDTAELVLNDAVHIKRELGIP